MKTAVFPYYKALYENLGLYEENKAAIRRYLVLASESSMPSGPWRMWCRGPWKNGTT